MATFYIQLENKLLQISGELTAENISKALGYVPVDSSTMNNYATKDEVSDLVDMSMVEELSQRVDNITFDSLKDNPFLQDGSGELNIVDEADNIIAKIDAEGIHSVDFIAGNHKLTDKIDSSALNGYAKESWVTTEITKVATEGKVDLTGYATEEWVANQNYLTEHQDISHLATKDEIPTKVSDLENDSNYLTEHQDISHLATKDEVNNVDFYNINNNPIVDGEENSLTLVDENGNIGLKVTEDGLYVKDIIADGHTLSQKADKSELSNYATKDEVSDLVDMSVVTELQGNVNTLINTDADKSVRDIAVDVLTETLVSETATEAYDTLAEMSAWIKSHPEDATAMNTAIQKNTTDITNLDAAYKAADAKVLTDAQEYTDNINFYTIKDNPIVDNNDGNLTFVDESGNIGLQFSNNTILVKDVITPEHTLSSKADKSFVEDNYYNKSTIDKKITEAVTGGQVSLDGFATEQWVNEQGFLKEHQDISHLAEKTELPTKTSDLTNDSGFITINDVPEVTVPTKVSELENDSKFITIEEVPEVTVPTKTSELTNDSGYITIEDVPVLEIPEEYVTETELNDKGFLTEHQDISHLASRNWVESQGYAKTEDIPSVDDLVKTEDLPNFDEFAKISDIPSLNGYATEEWVNNKNYATEYELKTIDYNSINNIPLIDDSIDELNVVDENGNIGMKVASEAVYAKDFVASEHKLSEKADKTYVDNSIAELIDGAPETLDTLNELAAALNNNADIVDVLNQSIGNKQDKLESGTNIKTINGESILGSGDITIGGGGGVSEDYVNTAIANAITTTLNIAV